MVAYMEQGVLQRVRDDDLFESIDGPKRYSLCVELKALPSTQREEVPLKGTSSP